MGYAAELSASGEMTHHGALLTSIAFAPGSSFAGGGILDVHVLQFAALEYLTAFHAFNEFPILFPGNDLHARVAALLVHWTAYWRHGVALRLR